MHIIRKVALAVFEKKKILLVRSSQKDEVFYSLGGKIKAGESDLECLKREVFEEVGCSLDEESLKFLHEFNGPAHGYNNSVLSVKLYEGKLKGDPKPSSEIFEIGFFDSNSPKKNLSEIAQTQILPWLKKKGYID